MDPAHPGWAGSVVFENADRFEDHASSCMQARSYYGVLHVSVVAVNMK